MREGMIKSGWSSACHQKEKRVPGLGRLRWDTIWAGVRELRLSWTERSGGDRDGKERLGENSAMLNYRKIEAADDAEIAGIIRYNLERFHLNIPGTAYFDPELDHLSGYYNSAPDKRVYFVALNAEGQVIGGVGIAEFDGIEACAELQKLYLDDSAKGKGCGKELIQLAEVWARSAGYKSLYLETHTNLSAALKLYEKMGFHRVEQPCLTQHSTMNRFYLKEL